MVEGGIGWVETTGGLKLVHLGWVGWIVEARPALDPTGLE